MRDGRHGHGHGGHDQGGHQDGHHHGGHQEGGDHGEHGGRGGAPDTEFLDLEISKVIQGEASSLARAAFGELLKDAIKERLRERLGDKIEALAKLTVDDALADLDANLAVEAVIAARAERRRDADKELRDVFRRSEPTKKQKKPGG